MTNLATLGAHMNHFASLLSMHKGVIEEMVSLAKDMAELMTTHNPIPLLSDLASAVEAGTHNDNTSPGAPAV